MDQFTHNLELQAFSKNNTCENCSLPSPSISFNSPSWIDSLFQLVSEVAKRTNN